MFGLFENQFIKNILYVLSSCNIGPLQANMYPNFVAFVAQPITKVPLVRQNNEALSAGERFLLNASIITGHSL